MRVFDYLSLEVVTMAKIGVYVPDDRMKDIERWREKMNFSQLFIEAFDRAVTAQADISKVKGKEMKAVVERLKRQADKTFEGGWKEGVSEGRKWAMKHAHVSHLRQIGEGELTFDKADSDVMDFLRWHYEGKGYRQTPEDEQAEMELDRFNDSETYRRGFNRGFAEAAKHVWGEIKDAF